MPQTIWLPAQSVETLHFTEALGAAAGTLTPPYFASAMYNLPIPGAMSRRYLIRAIRYQAKQQVGLQFLFFGSASGNTADPATDTFQGKFGFTSSQGEQIGNPAAGVFRWWITNLAIPYQDNDSINQNIQPNLHVIVQNEDTVAKSAAVPGQVQATIFLEPQQGW